MFIESNNKVCKNNEVPRYVIVQVRRHRFRTFSKSLNIEYTEYPRINIYDIHVQRILWNFIFKYWTAELPAQFLHDLMNSSEDS